MVQYEDIILLPRNNWNNFTLNIQNSPLRGKFYNFTFQQKSQVTLFVFASDIILYVRVSLSLICIMLKSTEGLKRGLKERAEERAQ